MATTSTIRGMLLEEAVLRLITVSGYTAISYDVSRPDPTLAEDKGALFACGRGEKHQIDALADFFLTPPFSHRQGRYVNSNLDNSPHVFRFQCSRSELQRLVQGTLW